MTKILWQGFKKFDLVAKVTKKKENLASFLLLYLEDCALAIYLELDDSSQAPADIIKTKQGVSFSDGFFSAFAKLSKL